MIYHVVVHKSACDMPNSDKPFFEEAGAESFRAGPGCVTDALRCCDSLGNRVGSRGPHHQPTSASAAAWRRFIRVLTHWSRTDPVARLGHGEASPRCVGEGFCRSNLSSIRLAHANIPKAGDSKIALRM